MEQMLADGTYHDQWQAILPALTNLAEIASQQGDYAAAHTHWQESLPYTEKHYPAHLPNLYRSLAHAAAAQKDYAAAWGYLETALEISRRTHAFDREGWTRCAMAALAFEQANRADALRHLRECIAVFQAHHEPRSVAQCLVKLAKFCVAWHEAERAAVLIGSAERAFEEYRFVASAKEQAFRAELTAETCRILGSEIWQAAWERGRQMTLAQAVIWATLETQTE